MRILPLHPPGLEYAPHPAGMVSLAPPRARKTRTIPPSHFFHATVVVSELRSRVTIISTKRQTRREAGTESRGPWAILDFRFQILDFRGGGTFWLESEI
jgi:hypothetical protein